MKPLENITIVEFSTMITASFAAMMMADQGARVIKVEPVEVGDPMRHLGTSKGGISALFANCNRGKQSMRLDLKQPEGLQIAQQLIQGADVVIHNYRPGVMDELGLGSQPMRAANPRLVYMAISGFGTEGPLRGAPAYDPVVQAHAGFTAVQGVNGPVFIRSLVCDKITAYSACQAVTAALFSRERTGEGQHIDMSMLDAGLYFLFPDGFVNNTLLDEDVELQPHLADMHQMTHTLDGGITISAANARHIAGVMRAIDREDLVTDPRFATMAARLLNNAHYQEILKTGFACLTSDEAVLKLMAHDVPCAKCHGFEEVIEQPQLQACGTVVIREHPLMGTMRLVRAPARFDGQALEPGSPCPAHGEQTDLLLESLGYDAHQRETLRQRRVVG